MDQRFIQLDPPILSQQILRVRPQPYDLPILVGGNVVGGSVVVEAATTHQQVLVPVHNLNVLFISMVAGPHRRYFLID